MLDESGVSRKVAIKIGTVALLMASLYAGEVSGRRNRSKNLAKKSGGCYSLIIIWGLG
jgi:hypothetical protein